MVLPLPIFVDVFVVVVPCAIALAVVVGPQAIVI